MARQAPKDKDKAAEQLKINEAKWSKPLMDAGWTAFPSVILERQQALGLDSLDVNILLYLATYWWTEDNKPHPSKNTIAAAVKKHPRTVQRRIAQMEKDGFILREERRVPGKGSTTNRYHFNGLIEAATPFALEKIEERERRIAENKSRPARKGRPTLSVVSSGKKTD